MHLGFIFVVLASFSSWIVGVHPIAVLPRQSDCPSIPPNFEFNSTILPDPFTFANGMAVQSLDDWTCRRSEIISLFAADELGTKPPRPPILTASLTSSGPNTATLSITCALSGSPSPNITFNTPITYPSTGTPPFPALIAFDGLSIPVPPGIATITLPVSQLAAQNSAGSRGQGLFYTLYGTSAPAGALTAFAWGVSRVIDALELTPSVQIDPTRVGVTGCSRNGKGAVVAGALDWRVALTIPQESGSGGTDCWRLSDALFAGGLVTQTASEIVQENVWFSTAFDEFANTTVDRMAVDHHMLMGLIAPRGLLVIDNIGFDWLGPESSFGCVKTARRVWGALGEEESIGISQAASHPHCLFPEEQQGVVNAFIDRFLIGNQSANTSVFETAGGYVFDTPGKWDPWSAPELKLRSIRGLEFEIG